MKRNKYIYAIFGIFILAIIVLLSFTILNSEYLFGWIARNWKFYLLLTVIALLLLLLNQRLASAFMSIGIAIGIFAGNFFGKSIKILNEGKIVEGMKQEEIWRLRHHPGFEIWIIIILLFIIIGIVMEIIVSRKRK